MRAARARARSNSRVHVTVDVANDIAHARACIMIATSHKQAGSYARVRAYMSCHAHASAVCTTR